MERAKENFCQTKSENKKIIPYANLYIILLYILLNVGYHFYSEIYQYLKEGARKTAEMYFLYGHYLWQGFGMFLFGSFTVLIYKLGQDRAKNPLVTAVMWIQPIFMASSIFLYFSDFYVILPRYFRWNSTAYFSMGWILLGVAVAQKIFISK